MTMKKLLVSLAMFALVGCSAVEQKIVGAVSGDLDVAIKRGEAVLGANDPLVVCYKALDKVVKAQLEADQLEGGLLLDAVMKARIISQVREQVAADLKSACSQIAGEVMIQAASRGAARLR
jgi:hypothetical protein